MRVRTKVLTSVLIALLAVCMMGLVGCNNNAGSGNTPTSAPSKSDEQIIKDDCNKVLNDAFKDASLSLALGEGAEMSQILGQAGLSTQDVMDAVMKNVSIEATDVKIDGDKATVTVSATLPDYNSADSWLDSQMEEKLGAIFSSSASEDEIMRQFGKVMVEILGDPNFPKTTTTSTVDYLKKDGQWQMSDEDQATAETFKNI